MSSPEEVHAAQQREGLGVPRLPRLDHPLGEPAAPVVALLGVHEPGRLVRKDVAGRVVAVGLHPLPSFTHDVSSMLALFCDKCSRQTHIDDGVQHRTELGVLDPAQRVARAHEEPPGVRSEQVIVPEVHRRARAPAGGGVAGAVAERLPIYTNFRPISNRRSMACRPKKSHREQVVHVEGGEQVVDVRLHAVLEQHVGRDVDAADRGLGAVGHDRRRALAQQVGDPLGGRRRVVRLVRAHRALGAFLGRRLWRGSGRVDSRESDVRHGGRERQQPAETHGIRQNRPPQPHATAGWYMDLQQRGAERHRSQAGEPIGRTER